MGVGGQVLLAETPAEKVVGCPMEIFCKFKKYQGTFGLNFGHFLLGFFENRVKLQKKLR